VKRKESGKEKALDFRFLFAYSRSR